jgi:hypothetical protein
MDYGTRVYRGFKRREFNEYLDAKGARLLGQLADVPRGTVSGRKRTTAKRRRQQARISKRANRR